MLDVGGGATRGVGILDLLIPVGIALGAFAFAQVHPILAVVVVLVALVWANPMFTVIDYRLTEAALEVTVCRAIHLQRIPYDEILAVRRVRWAELFTPEARWAESLGSNLFRPLVLVRRRGGRRAAIITPADADAFVEALRARVPPGGDPEAPAPGRAG